MLFVPLYKKIDWKHPPVITLLLILINCAVYFGFQTQDNERTQAAVDYYLSSRLPSLEFPRYIERLRKEGDYAAASDYERILDEAPQYGSAVLFAMESDGRFMDDLRSGRIITPQNPIYADWRHQREEFQQRMDRAVWHRFGLKPGAPTAVTLLTHMFLHGSVSHLVGNMIFLFLIGVVVEMALGPWKYLAAYLLTGLAAAGLDMALHPHSLVASVGASGAISGLMGLYTVLFGRRKINFFYWAFVYFDYVRAPAIILLPLWIGYQVVQLLLSGGDGVNYTAHIGGLSSGALIGLLAWKGFIKVNKDYLEQDERSEAYNRRYDQAVALMGKMEYEQAIPILRRLADENAGNTPVLEQLYAASKLRPDSEDFHDAARRLLSVTGTDRDTAARVTAVYREYTRLAKPKPRLPIEVLLRLTRHFAAGDDPSEAEKILRALLATGRDIPGLTGAAMAVAKALSRQGHPDKARRYLQWIGDKHPGTADAESAAQMIRLMETG